MCRTTVAIMRGESLWGDWWHRPQLVANLFSPSICNDSSSGTLEAEAEVPAVAGARVELEGTVGAGIGADFEARGGAADTIGAELETATDCDLAASPCCAVAT
jgi:hypothetical protein